MRNVGVDLRWSSKEANMWVTATRWSKRFLSSSGIQIGRQEEHWKLFLSGVSSSMANDSQHKLVNTSIKTIIFNIPILGSPQLFPRNIYVTANINNTIIFLRRLWKLLHSLVRIGIAANPNCASKPKTAWNYTVRRVYTVNKNALGQIWFRGLRLGFLFFPPALIPGKLK